MSANRASRIALQPSVEVEATRSRSIRPRFDATDIPATATALGSAVSHWRERTGKVCPTWSEVVGMLLDLGWTPPQVEIRNPLAAVRDVR